MSDDQIAASFTHLFEQGSMTASSYLNCAIRDIDQTFGDDYAHNHPELVAAYMNAAVNDLANSTRLKVCQGIARNLSGQFDEMINLLERFTDRNSL